MSLTIIVPDNLVTRLQRIARAQQRSVEQVALTILNDALEIEATFPTPEEIVAKIQSLPPDPQNIRVAQGSLADALRAAPEDPEFDLDRWNQEWAHVEAQMRAVTRNNDIAL